ncbi:AAA family ATPase [Desulfobulbus sp.]|uniref:AAA family ATPase n=1 Tax=Desulfobulbus sp. TaxID=895 RepID=UPI0027BA65F0|nr:AAA family ATPase [Desulfobulbus sp.]
MVKVSKLELLAEFGFSNDPFKQVGIKSQDHVKIGKVVSMAVKSRSMVAVIGERGIGKSNAVRSALDKLKNVRRAAALANDIHKLLIGDIEQALILDLSNEKPKRGREIRARQLRRILGEASTGTDVVLIIEEAHHLHGMTLRSLKRIREMDWMGKSELFSVILVGQSDPMNKPGVSEVKLRADAVQMKGLSPDEVEYFVTRAMKSSVAADAVKVIAGLPGSHNFEDLKNMLFCLMEQALLSGRRQVLLDDVEALFPSEHEKQGKQHGKARAAVATKTPLQQEQTAKAGKTSLRDLLSQEEELQRAAAG